MRPKLPPEAPLWQMGWHHYAVADAAELACPGACVRGPASGAGSALPGVAVRGG